MKKFISLALALVMALSLTTMAWGASYDCTGTCSDPTSHVAAVGNTHYDDLQEAVTAAASAADKTVTLLNDVTVAAYSESTRHTSNTGIFVPAGVIIDGNGYTLTVTGTKAWVEAQVTAGGVKLSEIDEITMESRLVPGLYLAGELLDADGPCGGFNLQWAWTTGILAGRALAAGGKV